MNKRELDSEGVPITATGGDVNLLLFRYLDQSFCTDLNDVVKILPLIDLRPVPMGPNYLVGLLNLGGEAIPVIDLALCLSGANIQAYTLDTPIIVCSRNEAKCGLIVTEVIGGHQASKGELQLDKQFKDVTSPCRGMVSVPQGQFLLLDLAPILDIDLSRVADGLGWGPLPADKVHAESKS